MKHIHYVNDDGFMTKKTTLSSNYLLFKNDGKLINCK